MTRNSKPIINIWQVLTLIGITSVLLIAGAYFYFSYESKSIRASKHREIQAIAEMKIQQLIQWHKDRTADVIVISQSPFFQDKIKEWIGNRNNLSLKKELIEQLSLPKKSYRYENIFISSPNGKLLLTLNDKLVKIDDATSLKIIDASENRQLTFTDLYKGTLHNKIHYDIIAPIINDQKVTIAALVFRVDPKEYLYPLIKSWPTQSTTSETFIFRKDGDNILYLSELSRLKNTNLNFRIPLTKKDDPAVQAVFGNKRIYEGKDYHGNDKILSYIAPVPGTRWYIVAQINQSEVYEELYLRALTIIIFTIGLILLVSAGLILIYRTRQRNIFIGLFVKEKELRESHEEFKTILYSIGDGVITTDINGRIRQMNHTAAELTGWSEKDAEGKPFEEVFNIIDDVTRSKVENPIAKVLSQKVASELTNHALLISKNGNEIPIADCDAPICDDLGKIEGSVLVFRDKTKEHYSEKIIRKSEARLRRAEFVTKAGHWELHLDSGNMIVSEGASKIYGLKGTQLKASNIQKMALHEYRSKLDDALRKLINYDNPLDIEFKIKKADTGEIVDIHAIAEYDKEKKIVFGIVQDITKTKQFEIALKDSEYKFRTLVENIKIGIYYSDFTGTFLYGNREAEEIVGYNRDELIGKNFIELKLLSQNQKIKAALLIGKSTGPDEFIINRKDGTQRIVEISTNVINTGSQKIVCGVVLDITERKQAEQTINLLAQAVRSTSDCISLTDTNNNIIFINESFLKTYGYEEKELIGKNIELVRASNNPDPSPEVIKNATLQNGWFGELLNRKKDGTVFPISLSTSSVLNEKGEPYALIGITRDITDYKKAEQELEEHRNHLEDLVETRTKELDRTNKKLQIEIEKEKEIEMMLQYSLEKEKELNELKTRFISIASHEFRTPLTSILSSAELIKRYGKKWSEDKFNEHAEKIMSSIEYLTDLLDDVLTISRSESGKIVFNPLKIDLHLFCRDIIEELKFNADKNHKLIFKYTADQEIFDLDPKLIRFIITNLLSNAFKYSPKGSKVELLVSSTYDSILINVKDEGIGIPEEDKAHLFEPFYRTHNVGEIEGTGLGLSIVKRAVDLHNGVISYHSELGKGTTFNIKLPRKIDE